MYTPSSPYPRTLSEVSGRIEEIVISTGEVDGATDLVENYAGLFDAFAGVVSFIIICPTRNQILAEDLKTQFDEQLEQHYPHEHLFIFEPDFRLSDRQDEPSRFIQDPFIVQDSPLGMPILLEPYYFGEASRSQDRYIAEQLSAHGNYLQRSTKYIFEGGNVIVQGRYAIIGKDTLIENLLKFYGNFEHGSDALLESTSALTEGFKKFLNVDYLIWLGPSKPRKVELESIRQGDYGYQPFFHIDLYLTAGGKTSSGEELIFLAELEDQELQLIEDEGVRSSWHEIKMLLDATKTQLETIHRHQPGPRFVVQTVPMGLRKAGDSYFPLSFNNCLMECYEHVKVAYIPRYRRLDGKVDIYLEELHERAQKTYESRGFEVNFIDGKYYDLSLNYSSLHCMAKVTRRSHLSVSAHY